MIQKAVEMGVGVLQPVITEHTQVRSINEKRIHANAIEAAEQCGIITLPEIKSPIRLRQLFEKLGEETTVVFCDEETHGTSQIGGLDLKPGQAIALLIGPEGGFSQEEREFLTANPRVARLDLGPRILRADTAAVAALAVLQAHYGDWYSH